MFEREGVPFLLLGSNTSSCKGALLIYPLIDVRTTAQQWCTWEQPQSQHMTHVFPLLLSLSPSLHPIPCFTSVATWSLALPTEQLLHFVHELMPRDVPWCSRAFWLRGRVCGGLRVRPWLCSQWRQVCGTERLWLRGQQWILSPCKLKHPTSNIHHIIASNLQSILIVCLESGWSIAKIWLIKS